MEKIINEIRSLCEEKDAVILAHYYVDGAVQDVADFVGDSFYLAKVAKTDPHKTIVFCGVTFMGQSASLLSPDKTVLMPDMNAVCPMALMVDEKTISEMRAQYDDLAVVCYINSMAEIKALSDVCVTSSNALKIVKSLPNRNIFFIPDGNLGRFIKEQCPDKNVILNRGYCHVHTTITARAVEQLFGENPDAEILVHPECISEVCELADFVGSTKEIIEHAASSPAQKFIVCTEYGVLHELKMRASQKEYFFPGGMPVCNNMKKVTLEKVRDCLKNSSPSITVSDEIREAANRPLERMLQLG